MLIQFVAFLIRALMMLIVVSSLLSWFNPDPRNRFVRLIHHIVDPIMHPIQMILPPIAGMDFSPLVAILLLGLLRSLILSGPAF